MQTDVEVKNNLGVGLGILVLFGSDETASRRVCLDAWTKQHSATQKLLDTGLISSPTFLSG